MLDPAPTVRTHRVGFHNADLDRAERLVLEADFRDPSSRLRVLVATTTLAMGVNTPAEAVVIAGLMHPQNQPFSVAEYKNMAGRAGRPGQSEKGESYVVATSSKDVSANAAWTQYVLASPEDIHSHFLSVGTDPRTLILRSLVALSSSVAESGLLALLNNSFAVWLATESGRSGWDSSNIRRHLDELIDAQLVDREPSGALTLTDLGKYAGESGIEVQSIINVASALRGVPTILTVEDIVTLSQVTLELDAQHIPSNKKARLEQSRWQFELSNRGVASGLLSNLHVGGGQGWARAKRAVACLMYIDNIGMNQIEKHLLQHTRDTSAAGNVRNVAARTRDVLDAVVRIAEYSGHNIVQGPASDLLALRLEMGLPTAALPLASKFGIHLTRGQYLMLVSNEVVDPAHLTSDQLKAIFGVDLSDSLIGLISR